MRFKTISKFGLFFFVFTSSVKTYSLDCIPTPSSSLEQADVIVHNNSELQNAIGNLSAGDIIQLEPGVYNLTNTLVIREDNVTLQGNSLQCDEVVLAGYGMDDHENKDIVPHGIWSDSDSLTVKNLTIKDVYYHAIALNAGAHNVHLRNLQLVDSGEQLVKSSSGGGFGNGNNNGIVEYSAIGYSTAPSTESHGTGAGYTNGVDVHGGSNWIIRNNTFSHFHTDDSAAYRWNPVVLMWNGSANTLVENNVFLDVDRAIAFGLGEKEEGPDHLGGLIGNNMITYSENLMSSNRTADSDAAILVWASPNTKVMHNTILTNGNINKSIELRYNSNATVIKNNIIDSPIGDRSSNTFVESDNLTINTSNIFVEPSVGNLHLQSDVDTISVVPLLEYFLKDIDGDDRNIQVEIMPGADQPGASSSDLAPNAIAGPDQPPVGTTILTGDVVSLDGSNSSDDNDASALTYSWLQTAGSPTLVLDDPSLAATSFTAPAANGSAEFELTVCDTLSQCDSDSMIVSFEDGAPIALAGPNQGVEEFSLVQLDGSNSSDSNGSIASYLWQQVSGTATILLSNSTIASPTFTSPAAFDSLEFRLRVTDDDGLIADDHVIINVGDLPAPVCVAGPNQTVEEYSDLNGTATQVQLDGGNSSVVAPYNISGYLWAQVSGPSVSLSDSASVAPTFSAPEVDLSGASLGFELTCTSSAGPAATGSMTITVGDTNRPPQADAGTMQQVSEAAAVSLDATLSSDPDGDLITYSWSISGAGSISVTLDDPNSATPNFTAPSLDAAGGFTQFTVTVSDGTLTDTSNVTVNYGFSNGIPVPVISAPSSATGRTQVSLDGSDSNHTGAQAITHLWAQTAGTQVALNNINSATADFIAPDVGLAGETLSFRLQVSDGSLQVTSDLDVEINHDPSPPTITAQNLNQGANSFTGGSGEHVVLGFSLNADSAGAQLDSLTFDAAGSADDSTAVSHVALYLDNNGDGVAQTTELLAEGSYDSDNASLTFILDSSIQLPAGATRFLVTYTL